MSAGLSAALKRFMHTGLIVLDSSWLHHFGNNPIRGGATQYFGALDEIATLNAAMSLVK
jgi:hypothetical protein